jgi:CheY-like chemotaxis protein
MSAENSDKSAGDSAEKMSFPRLAHEFHNLLAAMLGDLDFLRDGLAELGEQAGKAALLECAATLLAAARRAVTLAKPLVELAKQGAADPEAAPDDKATENLAIGPSDPTREQCTEEPSGDNVAEWSPEQKTPGNVLAVVALARQMQMPGVEAEGDRRRAPSRGGAAVGSTILVVEDVESERRSVTRFLEKLGYGVVAVSDGREAVRVFREEHHGIALVLLDLVIPGLSGRETLRTLRNTDPNVRVLLVSGYVDEDRTDELLAEGAVGFLRKPFTLDTLRRAVVTASGGVRPVEPDEPA